MSIPFEQISTLSDEMNIRIIKRQNNSQGRGCEFHWHEPIEFYYVVSGGVLLSAAGEENWLYSGDIGFVNSFIPHRGMRFLENTIHYIVQIDTEFFKSDTCLKQNRSYDSVLTECLRSIPSVIRSDEKLSSVFARLTKEENERTVGFELAVKSCIYEIFTILMRMSDGSDSLSSKSHNIYDRDSLEHVKKILRYLSLNYMYPQKVSLLNISRCFGLSKPYICRIFKAHTNSTITQYLTDIRAHNAAALIQNGTSLQEACLKVGIDDYNYFSRMVKKSTGHTPSYFKHI